ncbi:MAG: hypothetical protein WC792_05875 [Candidatus Micrarchaeia archaeon]
MPKKPIFTPAHFHLFIKIYKQRGKTRRKISSFANRRSSEGRKSAKNAPQNGANSPNRILFIKPRRPAAPKRGRPKCENVREEKAAQKQKSLLSNLNAEKKYFFPNFFVISLFFIFHVVFQRFLRPHGG